MRFYTIGVYGSTEQSFFDKLKENKIDTFCDIRQRRGVRGKKYAYVNSLYLQKKLKECGIRYLYVPNLAPTSEIRNIQKKTDKKDNISKSNRVQISKDFELEYKNKVLSTFDFDSFITNLETSSAATNVVLFCVEETAEACHRSIVANALHLKYNNFIKNL
ncbi:DUF488 domain-containing protein [Bacteroides graminisolvens]|uniref:DUF488 domain-containing protein n=1 Tax=Bacteroides graminisolvens DSM 19988 = JCM 15093 TaxID=1121097 RepID=A0A069D6K3_9BACE|nr:DUF488 domain-containing protein [Bacteroides graminisolvens]GAK37941.1 hypothetical protein JCM15093_3231 [Bacteroides graminisolvens DSM 19988 = JCM 15093]